MRYLSVPLLLTLAACQTAIPLEPHADPCKSLGYLSVVGTMEDAVPAGTFPEGTRFLHPGAAVTQDHRAERLNVHVNEKGRIERIDCG